MALGCGINRKRVIVGASGQGRNPRTAIVAAFRRFLIDLVRTLRSLILFARQRCPRKCPAKEVGPIQFGRSTFRIRFNPRTRRWICVLGVQVSITVKCKRKILKRKRYRKA